MLSLSERFVQGRPADAATWTALAQMAATDRRWAHYTNLLVGASRILLLLVLLYRARLVPRAFAGATIAAAALQLAAVTMPILGRPMVFALLAPLGVLFLALAFWLVARGFSEDAAAGG
jgi:hypothetical protein